jgi:hypothetical protein
VNRLAVVAQSQLRKPFRVAANLRSFGPGVTVGMQGDTVNAVDLSDPRSTWEKAAHRLLKATQKNRANRGVRGFEKFLRALGW